MSASSNINNVFFDGAYKHAWKKTIPPGLTEAETDFIMDQAGLEKDDRALDLMCGYGRHALELGRRSIETVAVDNLADYVEEIKSLASKEQLPVRAVQSDVLDYRPESRYKAAICMGNSFAFFDRTDATRLLQQVSKNLEPGGAFIINSWTIAEIAIRYFKEKDWHFAGEYKCVLENRYCFQPSRVESEQTIISPDGSVETTRGVDYILTLDELEQMFLEAGLFSTPRKRPFQLGDARVYIVARKS